jgi:hypothetical protein
MINTSMSRDSPILNRQPHCHILLFFSSENQTLEFRAGPLPPMELERSRVSQQSSSFQVVACCRSLPDSALVVLFRFPNPG